MPIRKSSRGDFTNPQFAGRQRLAIGDYKMRINNPFLFSKNMLTKEQKVKKVEEAQKLLKESKSLIFVDFSGINVGKLRALRGKIGEAGAKFKVFRKRLMRVAFEKEGIDFNPERFESQVGTVFAAKDISEIAGPVYKSEISILGAYDLSAKNFIDAEKVKFIGKLPAREVLLGQLVGIVAAPIKTLLYVLQERSKKVG